MLKKSLAALALLAGTQLASAAICATSGRNLGTLPGDGGSVSFSAACTVLGNPGPNSSSWSFMNTFNFSLSDAASVAFGSIDLNYTRVGEYFPNSPNRGDALFEITTSAISFIHDGVETFVGTEGAGHHEQARIFAQGLEAGDYQMVIRGRVFDTSTNFGFYDGTLSVSYDTPAATTMSSNLAAVAAPVPEPGALATLLLGLPAVALAVRRSRRRRDAA
jgi:hypothetical protein